jgi:hypothetical protein
VTLEVEGGTPPDRRMTDGASLAPPPIGVSISWRSAGPGFARIP